MEGLLVVLLYLTFFVLVQVFSKRAERKLEKKFYDTGLPLYKKIFASLERLSRFYNLNLKLRPDDVKQYEGDYKLIESVEGRINNIPLSIVPVFSLQFEARSIDVTISHYINPEIMGYIKIFKESPGKKIDKAIGMNDVIIGEEEFDDKFIIKTVKDELAIAVFARETRAYLCDLYELTGNFELSNSWFKFSLNYYEELVSDHIYTILDKAVAISKQLSREDIREALLENIKSNDLQQIRNKQIGILFKKYPVDESVLKELKQFLKGCNDVKMKILLASFLGDYGFEVIRKMLIHDNSLNDSAVIIALEVLTKNNYLSDIDEFTKRYETTENIEIKLALLKAFEKSENIKFSDFLTRELEKADAELKIAVIKALSTTGTVSSVEKLYYLYKNHENGKVRNEAMQAVSMIQEKLGDVEKGWLSHSESTEIEGALSRSEDLNGALSKDK